MIIQGKGSFLLGLEAKIDFLIVVYVNTSCWRLLRRLLGLRKTL
jgi:hypothetical protein